MRQASAAAGLIGLAFVICALIGPAHAVQPNAAAGETRSSDDAALLAFEAQWNEAVVSRDVAALERIIADDFVLIWVDGSLSRKADLLRAVHGRKAEIDPFVTKDVLVRVYGDVAVVTGRFEQTVRLGEQSQTGSYRYTDVYRRSGGTWQAVSAHATLLRR